VYGLSITFLEAVLALIVTESILYVSGSCADKLLLISKITNAREKMNNPGLDLKLLITYLQSFIFLISEYDYI
jgi:hypothetical protein